MAIKGMGDPRTAQRTRDAIARVVRQELRQAGVQPKWATVTQIDPDFGTCRVVFRGEAQDVPVKMGSIQPSEVGQVVRVIGAGTDLWVADVVGRAALTGATSSFLTAPVNFTLTGVGPGLVARWNGVALADRYELQIAEDAGFTVNVRNLLTLATEFALGDLTEGLTYYGRVRAVSSSSSVGPYSTADSEVIPGYPAPAASDGSPPGSSPQPACSSGLGMLFVEWDEVPNNDLVTYEVHADLESGFTPSPATLIAETTAHYITFRRLAGGALLPYDNPTFVRLIAKDADGAAAPGAQGFATPDQIGSGDFGSVGDTGISDGVPPADSPADFTVTPGIGYLFLTWGAVANDDTVTYEVHMSTGDANFLPTANTLVGETKGTFIFLRERPPGFGGGPLTYETTYQIKIWAKDSDGYATTPSPAKTGTSIKTSSEDIGDNAVQTVHITDAAIVTAKIANLAVGEAQIQNLAVTEAKIGDAAITNAKIANASIDQAKIGVAAIGSAQIADAAITDAHIADLSADKISAGTISGISITGGTITGANLRTASSGQRIVINSGGGSGFIYYYSGDANEQFPGFIRAGYGLDPTGADAGYLTIAGPKVSSLGNNSGALVELWQRESDGEQLARISGDLYLKGHLVWDNSSEFTMGPSPTSTRFTYAQTEVNMFYSSGNRELRLQPDGDMVIYDQTTSLWSAGTGGISDLRLKKNVVPAPPLFATNIIRQLNLYRFDYDRDKASLPPGRRFGILAQDVQTLFPQGARDVGGTLHLDAHSIALLAVGAVKELEERVKDLEAPTP